MKKGKKAVGAPAHVQLFSTMMILLLAFFIVLNSLIDADNETGFQNNIGDIQNAFGITGGIGMLAHHFMCAPIEGVSRRRNNPEEEKFGQTTHHSRGAGGVGNNEIEPEQGTPVYLRVVVPHRFAAGDAAIPAKLADYLDVAGTVLASYPDYRCTLRQITTESGDWQQDARLAQRRAVAVQRYLRQSCALPAERVAVVAYADWATLGEHTAVADQNRAQCLMFDLWKAEPEASAP
jgi:flagellar motor protein MotB